jgi:hypothetical protein
MMVMVLQSNLETPHWPYFRPLNLSTRKKRWVFIAPMREQR